MRAPSLRTTSPATPTSPTTRRRRVPLVLAIAVLGLTPGVLAASGEPATAGAPATGEKRSAASAGAASGRAAPARLPLGRTTLPESRRSRTIAPGVNWTVISRGGKPTTPSAIATTAAGPWSVNIVSIDPRAAKGRLLVSAGADLRRAERTSTLARASKALFAVNGGFFAYTASKEAPGDPYGLSVLGGTIVSEPLRGAGAVAMTIDSASKRLNISTFTWSATLRAGTQGATLPVKGLNRPPALVPNCEPVPEEESGETSDPPANPTNPLTCQGPGEIIRYTGHWGPRTPAGPGAEVIVDRTGCVVRTRTGRGGPLSPAHVSYQATGTSALALLDLAGAGCLRFGQQLRDANGQSPKLTSTVNAVNGRQVLVRNGTVVENRSGPGFAGRHPRTIAGRTAGGVVAFLTIDGRRTTSVGATLAEAARVARSVGLVDAVNLDGGGSTTMVVNGTVVNRVSGRAERAVGDAIVYLPR